MNYIQVITWGWGDRECCVIESVFLHSPDKGFWACLGQLPQTCPDVQRPRAVTIDEGIPFISRERPNVKHSIVGCFRLPRPTPMPALMRELHWHLCWAEAPGYTTGNPPKIIWPDTWMLQLSLNNRCRLVLSIPAVGLQHATDRTDGTLMTSPGQKVVLLQTSQYGAGPTWKPALAQRLLFAGYPLLFCA